MNINRFVLPAMTAVFFIFTTISMVHAQQFAKIKLNNNSYIKGNIVQGFDSTGIILKINGTTSRLPMSAVKHIKLRSEWNNPASYQAGINDQSTYLGGFSQFEKGYFHSVGLGILSGNQFTGFTASVINGYRFYPLLQAGIGINYNKYEHITTVPIYAEYRCFPKELKFAPYLFTQLGYGLRVEDNNNTTAFETYDSRGGLYWGVGVGYQINFYETAMGFSIGYSNQHTKTEYTTPEFWGTNTIEFSEKRMMGRMDIKICLVF